MRTTLTLEPDVLRLVEEAAAEQRKSVEQIINEALRRGLPPSASTQAVQRFRVRPHRTSLLSGVDVGAFNRLADELEDETVTGATRSAP